MDEDNKKAGEYSKRPMWQWLLVYAVIAVVLYGFFYYFVLAKNNGNNSTQTGIYQQNASPVTQTATPVAAAEKITVEGNEFIFTPSTITLKKGQPAEITFKNTGKFPHNLTITDLGIATKTIEPGEQDTITLTPDKTGSFPFLCSVGTHAAKGMKGILMVE